MVHKKECSSILLASASFIGGLTAGLLLAPEPGRRNRKWLRKRANSLSRWIDNQRQSIQHKGRKELRKVHTNVQQGIRQNVPDLYSATEHIGLSKRDINSEW
jgi:gas vesicle protein